jgi:hypothetical protein
VYFIRSLGDYFVRNYGKAFPTYIAATVGVALDWEDVSESTVRTALQRPRGAATAPRGP